LNRSLPGKGAETKLTTSSFMSKSKRKAVFNTLSSMASSVKGLDPMEFSKIFLDSEGLTIYGEFDVANYQEDTAIAEAIINNLTNNLLATGFDLKQS
jgi:hypothetical protein